MKTIAEIFVDLYQRAQSAEYTVNYAFGEPTTYISQNDALAIIEENDRLRARGPDRKLFAAMIMQAIVASNPGGAPGDMTTAAKNAVKATDALLKELAK